jgi:hypothetical protein
VAEPDHLYDHMRIMRNSKRPYPSMHQFVAGTAGAPFYGKGEYRGKNSYWKLERVNNIVNTYGYLLVTIDGPLCTVEFKGRVRPGVYKTMDKWNYRV